MSQVRRRFLIGASALLAASLATAQQPQKLRRIGILSPAVNGSAQQQRLQEWFRDALQRIGYQDGKNVVIEWRFSNRVVGDLLANAQELVRLKVDLIIASGDEAIVQARLATRTIPIVMVFASLPVENGFVESLARPGGNVTGTLWSDPETHAKILDVLREVAPRAVRIAVGWNRTFPFEERWREAINRAASALGMNLQFFFITRTEEVGPALERIAEARPDAVFLGAEAIMISRSSEIAAFAIERKLLVIANAQALVNDGCLLAYSPDPVEGVARAAYFVDRVLRGAKPGDLPAEMPTKYLLTINAKTARAIGYKIPQSLLLRANRMIE